MKIRAKGEILSCDEIVAQKTGKSFFKGVLLMDRIGENPRSAVAVFLPSLMKDGDRLDGFIEADADTVFSFRPIGVAPKVAPGK